jgi:uncharacterized protein
VLDFESIHICPVPFHLLLKLTPQCRYVILETRQLLLHDIELVGRCGWSPVTKTCSCSDPSTESASFQRGRLSKPQASWPSFVAKLREHCRVELKAQSTPWGYLICWNWYSRFVELFPRGLLGPIQSAWRSSPIVVLEGLRATGKTTLARSVVAEDRFFSFADPQTRDRAKSDPQGWLEALPNGSAVDEAQLVPGLTLVAKTLVDSRGGVPGQFLFTGSSRISRSELGGSDALVGRARWLRVEPLAQCEIGGAPRDVVSALFDEDPRSWTVEPVRHPEMIRRFSCGGLPTMRNLSRSELLIQLDQYCEGLLNGEVFSTGKNRNGILGLFRHLSATSSEPQNFNQIGSKVELSKPTIQGYLEVLRDVFLIESVGGYRPNPAKRYTETPRLFTTDPAFVAAAVGLSPNVALFDSEHGRFLETVVATELRRLVGWTTTERVKFLHSRKNGNEEVDLILEGGDSKMIAIEVKAARSPGRDAVNGIQSFRREYPGRFHRGFVIHAGDRIERMAEDIWAIPFSALWTIGESVAQTPASGAVLADRLEAARLQITLDRIKFGADGAQASWLMGVRIENAAGRFSEVAGLFDMLIPTLTDFGLAVELSDVDVGSNEPDVAWWARRTLSIAGPQKAIALRLQSRLLSSDLDRIGWVLSYGFVGSDGMSENEFGGSFTTPWDENPFKEVEERFARFADDLPQVLESLTKPEGT